MIVPSALHPGDTIYAVAPSGPFDPTNGWRGLGWLRCRYRVKFDRNMFQSCGFLAGSDERRRDELQQALQDPDCRAIVAMRGGYGAQRIAHQIDWNCLRSDPKWIVGFSDITALHVEVARHHVASIHAPMVAALARSCHQVRDAWIDAVENPSGIRKFDLVPAFDACGRGRCEGRLFGGNLAVLHACSAASRLCIAPDTVLFIEEIGERPYRIDRYLTSLIVGGHFDRVVGVVLGQFTDCLPGPDKTDVLQVVQRALAPLGIPVAAGINAGHDIIHLPLHFGAHASVVVQSRASLRLSL